jgi:hypothetical protein
LASSSATGIELASAISVSFLPMLRCDARKRPRPGPLTRGRKRGRRQKQTAKGGGLFVPPKADPWSVVRCCRRKAQSEKADCAFNLCPMPHAQLCLTPFIYTIDKSEFFQK